MSPAESALLARITREAAKLQPDAAKQLLAAYDTIRAALTETELLRALRNGQLDALLTEILEGSDDAFSSLRALVDERTLQASRDWHGFIPSRFRTIAFDQLNPRVIQAVRELDTAVVQTLRAEVRETVLQAATEGIQAGKGPRAIARNIRDVIGLSPSQERAIANFRAELESGDRAALNRVLGRGVIRQPDGTEIHRKNHAGGKGLGTRDLATLDRRLGAEPLTAEQVARYEGLYRKRLLDVNTEAHTRSIALDSSRLAQRNSWQDSIDQGIVDVTRIRRTWVTVGDARVRPEHQEMNGETIGWDGVYSNGEKVPGANSWNCRCIERVTLSPAAARAA